MASLRVAGFVLVLGAVGCTPDHFSYQDDGPGAGQPTDCDGEGCSESCPPGTVEVAPGVCQATCARWRTAVSFATPSGIAVSSDRAYAIGTSSSQDGRPEQAQLVPLFACSGATADAVQPLAGDASMAGAVQTSSASVFAAGTSEVAGANEPVVVELDGATLATKSTTALTGLPAGAVPLGMASDASGVWVVGRSGPDGSPAPWLARVVPAVGVCATTLPGSGEARAVGALADGAVVAVDRLGKLSVLRVDVAGCTPPNCACALGSSVDPTPIPGTDVTSPHALSVLGRTAFVAGHAQSGAPDAFGFVTAIDVDSGQIVASTSYDAGAGTDGFLALATDGDRLFAAGLGGAKSVADLGDAHATVAAFSLPLEQDAAPIWNAAIHTARSLTHLAAAPDLGVFGVGFDSTAGGVVVRCDGDGC